ncbi:MAG: DNA adenine methylase [Prevotella sp.]|nr:DNA adenine methylase [Prevotella sp.]
MKTNGNSISKPFVKWAGGKGQLLSTYQNLLPEHMDTMGDLTYIEPFVGGGAMLFFVLQNFPNIKRAVINDLNADLITAYRMVKHHPIQLIQVLQVMEREYMNMTDENLRKDYYLSVRNKFNEKRLSDIDNAACFIFLNKTCFNGLYRVNSKGSFNVPHGKYKNPCICDKQGITKSSELLQKVEIMCGDFEQTEQYVTKQTFMYFDPPYRPIDATSAFTSYTKFGFNDDEQVRLKKFFDRLSHRNCLIMLSNSDQKEKDSTNLYFDKLYQDYIIERVLASRSINSKADKRGKISEILIRNYEKTISLEHTNTHRIIHQ